MLTRRQSLRLCVLSTLAIAPVPLYADSPQQILGLTLGSSAPIPSQALAVFGLGGLAVEMIEPPALVDVPAPHYILKLARNRVLSIWFDANSSDRPIYWIELSEGYDPPTLPPPSYSDILRDLGQTDYEIPGARGASLAVLLVTIDPSLEDERIAATRRHIEGLLVQRQETSSQEDLFVEIPLGMEYRFKVLSDSFRGKIAHIYTHSARIDGLGLELIDTRMARTALGLP